MKKKLWILGSLIIGVFYLACSEPQPKPLNPNGDSELAILMREMYQAGESLKRSIHDGRQPKVDLDLQSIFVAEATEPEKASSDAFKAYAQAYVGIMQSFNDPDNDHMISYNAMVDNCESCHKAMCPGPLVRIKKLRI